MRFPNKVQISGKTYTVRQDKDLWGGNGGTGRQEIVVGVRKDQTVDRRFGNYMHEIAELVCAEHFLRYEAADEEIVFVMNHKQFDRVISDVATAILPMIKP